MTIRRTHETDLPGLVDYVFAARREDLPAPLGARRTAEARMLEIAIQHGLLFGLEVVCEGGVVHGGLVVCATPAHPLIEGAGAHVWGVYVDPDARSPAVWTGLRDELDRLAREHGWRWIALACRHGAAVANLFARTFGEPVETTYLRTVT